ncbi:hypothetical protein P3T27_006372, partial [Kitasatospora sp. MAA19]
MQHQCSTLVEIIDPLGQHEAPTTGSPTAVLPVPSLEATTVGMDRTVLAGARLVLPGAVVEGDRLAVEGDRIAGLGGESE